MISHIGELAALGTSFCWTITALAFEYSAKRIGSMALNILRLVAALLMFALIGLFLRGELLPLSAGSSVWFWLSLSGLVGFVFGDIFLFQAYIDIGARTTQVLFASSPLFTALMGFFFLGERVPPLGALGMFIVVAGIMLVIWKKNPSADPERLNAERLNADSPGMARPAADRPGGVQPVGARRVRGALFAVLGALGQSGGLILSKIGAPSYDPIGATQIRVVAGLLGFLALGGAMKKLREPVAALRDRKALSALSLGAFFGPFLGVTLGLFAVQRTGSGSAATLMGLTPILILIPAFFMKKERITLREGAGALLAVLGSTLLFLR
jgi:drug/metabolite transporter (DMT)-like permease